MPRKPANDLALADLSITGARMKGDWKRKRRRPPRRNGGTGRIIPAPPGLKLLNNNADASGLEAAFWRLVVRHGMAGLEWERQVAIGTAQAWVFDFAIPPLWMLIEIDGGTRSNKRSGHNSIAGIQRDRDKSNDAVALGWAVLRYTSEDVINRIDKTFSNLEATIARQTERFR
jgi:very-short-patch-repair endonuclease